MASFYADEQFPGIVVKLLRALGHNSISPISWHNTSWHNILW